MPRQQQQQRQRQKRCYRCCCCCCCCCSTGDICSYTRYKPISRPDSHLHTLPFNMCWLEPNVRRFLRNFIQTTVLAFIVLIIVLWLGAEYEQYQIRQMTTTDTLSLYNEQTTVCVNANANNTVWDVQTMDSIPDEITAAIKANETTTTIVAHCGNCGACSNPHDIGIYDATKNTLLANSTTCAKHGLLWGRKTARKCLRQNVGFSPSCNNCWVENIMCDLRKCIFTCLWYGLFFQEIDGGDSSGSIGSIGEDGSNKNVTAKANKLNPCTTCDERRCGPQFVTCAGANRRRSGIFSDIERDKEREVCPSIYPPQWWKDPNLQHSFQEQEQYEQREQQNDDNDSSSHHHTQHQYHLRVLD